MGPPGKPDRNDVCATAISLLLRPCRGDEAKPHLLTGPGARRAKNADAYALRALVPGCREFSQVREDRPHVSGPGVCAVAAVVSQVEATVQVGHEDGSQF